MAEIKNIQVYKEAAKGKRIFTLPSRNANAVKLGLWRRGYRVRMRQQKSGIVELTIYAE